MKLGRAILIASIVVAAFALTVSTGAAHGHGGEGIEEHLEHLAKDVCEMGSSIEIMTFAVIGLLVVNVISLIASLVKKK